MNKIIFLNQSTGYMFADVVNAFARSGYECTLLASQSDEKTNYKLDDNVKFIKGTPYDRTSFVRRIKTWLSYTFQANKYVMNHIDEDLFIVSNPPLTMFIPLLHKCSYSMLIYDTYPDALVSVGMLKDKNPIIRWWKNKNRQIFGNAKVVYTLSDNMAKNLTQYCDEKKIRVIPNWSYDFIGNDTPLLKFPLAHSANHFLLELGLQDKFIVLYSGNIGNTHKVETLVAVASLLKDVNQIHFLIIGDGSKKSLVEKMVNEQGLENCTILPFLPRNKMVYSLGAADIGVITLSEGASDVSVPSKTYNMLGVGAALMCIASPDTELGYLVRTFNVGKTFISSDTEGMKNFILSLASDKDSLLLYKRNSIDASKQFTSRNAEKYVEQYL